MVPPLAARRRPDRDRGKGCLRGSHHGGEPGIRFLRERTRQAGHGCCSPFRRAVVSAEDHADLTRSHYRGRAGADRPATWRRARGCCGPARAATETGRSTRLRRGPGPPPPTSSPTRHIALRGPRAGPSGVVPARPSPSPSPKRKRPTPSPAEKPSHPLRVTRRSHTSTSGSARTLAALPTSATARLS